MSNRENIYVTMEIAGAIHRHQLHLLWKAMQGINLDEPDSCRELIKNLQNRAAVLEVRGEDSEENFEALQEFCEANGFAYRLTGEGARTSWQTTWDQEHGHGQYYCQNGEPLLSLSDLRQMRKSAKSLQTVIDELEHAAAFLEGRQMTIIEPTAHDRALLRARKGKRSGAKRETHPNHTH